MRKTSTNHYFCSLAKTMVPPTRVNYDYKFKLQSSIYKSIDLDNKIQFIHPPRVNFPFNIRCSVSSKRVARRWRWSFSQVYDMFSNIQNQTKMFFIFYSIFFSTIEKEISLYTRVSWKPKNIFLSPADFTPSAFMYEESKTPIARL